MLDYAQRYTHAIDWSTLSHADKMLHDSNAFEQGEDAKLKVDWDNWAKAALPK